MTVMSELKEPLRKRDIADEVEECSYNVQQLIKGYASRLVKSGNRWLFYRRVVNDVFQRAYGAEMAHAQIDAEKCTEQMEKD
jgi:hypothetical protein